MTKKNIIIIIVSIVLISAIVWYLFFKKPKTTTEIAPVTTTPTGANSISIGTNTSTSFPLKQGSTGESVKLIQELINALDPTAKLTLDGVWGQNTNSYFIKAIGAQYIPVTQPIFTNLMNQLKYFKSK